MYEELRFPSLGSELLDFLKKENEDQKARKKFRATTLHRAMTMRRRRSYQKSIRATDKRAAENKKIIDMESLFAKKTETNSSRVEVISDRHRISHTHNN
jgi:CRISPR/Cas system-associated protein endoribonuclease Cas2